MNRILNCVLLIDGSYLLHRQLRQSELYNLKNSKGESIGGVQGFLKSLNKQINDYPKYFPVVVFDKGLSQRRIRIDEYYKRANERDNTYKLVTNNEVEDEYITQYRTQRTILSEILPYMGIPVLMYDGYEGDDIIYMVSQMCNDCLLISDDKDMLQLLSDSCKVYRPIAKEFCTYDKFIKSRNYTDIFDFVIYKAIIGDKSDNIPSACKGVGDKTVLPLIKLVREFSADRQNNKWYDLEHNFPRTVERLQLLCGKFDLTYKKSYLNFDVDRFIKNVGLVDLILCDDLDHIKSHAISQLENCDSKVNFFAVMQLLSKYGVYDIQIEQVISGISIRHKKLFVRD
jgi:5'-3' exonuclease